MGWDFAGEEGGQEGSSASSQTPARGWGRDESRGSIGRPSEPTQGPDTRIWQAVCPAEVVTWFPPPAHTGPCMGHHHLSECHHPEVLEAMRRSGLASSVERRKTFSTGISAPGLLCDGTLGRPTNLTMPAATSPLYLPEVCTNAHSCPLGGHHGHHSGSATNICNFLNIKMASSLFHQRLSI